MKRILYYFICFIMISFIFTIPVQASAAPEAPSWIKSDEYVVYDDDKFYQSSDWNKIMEMRKYAESGATTPTDEMIEFTQQVRYREKATPAVFFELGLIGEKLWRNGGSADYMRYNFSFAVGLVTKTFLFEKVYGYDPSSYMACVWFLRAKAAASELPTDLEKYKNINRPDLERDYEILLLKNDLNSWYELLSYPEFNREKVLDYPSFDQLKKIPEYQDLFSRINILIDEQALLTQNAPEIINGTTMLPIAPVAESLGAVVTWDNTTKTVAIQRVKDTIKLTIGSKTAYKNGEPISLSVAPYIKNGNTYLPVRFVAEQFGQVVEWDPRRIIRIYEDPNILNNTNLDEWATAMSSIHTATWPAGNEYHFGVVNRNAFSAKMIRDDVLAGWSIDSREDLLYQIYALPLRGHNKMFLKDSDMVKTYSTQERNEILKEGGEDADFILRNEAIAKKWGERGLRAFDLFRVSELAQWGYTAGYLNLEEALALVEPAVYLLKEDFSSWDEAAHNYLDGYSYWAFRASVKDEYEARLQRYNSMKERSVKGIPPVYDDTLWNTPIQPVKGVSYEDLLKEL